MRPEGKVPFSGLQKSWRALQVSGGPLGYARRLLPEAEMRVLADTPEYRIVHYRHRLPSEAVLITFDGFGTGKADRGFSSGFALKRRIDHIYVSQKLHSQYQGLSRADFARHVAPAIRGQRALCYGVSLGGYCALYYGGEIGADVLALSPRSSVHPAVTAKRGAPRVLKGLEIRHDPVWPVRPAGAAQVNILLDPHVGDDVMFFRQVVRPAFPGLRLTEVPYGGHELAMTLQAGGCLGDLVLAALRRLPLRVAPDPDNPLMLTERARGLLKAGQAEEAAGLLLRAVASRVPISNPRLKFEAHALLTKLWRDLDTRPELNPEDFAELRQLAVAEELFDAELYLRNAPEAVADPLTGGEPFLHFLLLGAFEDGCATSHYVQSEYLRRYPSLNREYTHPYLHYLLHGKREGRQATG